MRDTSAGKFFERYGEYFVIGTQRGASATINLRFDRTDTSTDFSIDASLSGSYSKFGVEGEGSASFQKEVAEKYGLENQ